MAVRQDDFHVRTKDPRLRLFFSVLFLWGVVAICLSLIALDSFNSYSPTSKLFLLPWSLAAGVVIVGPSALLIKRRQFHPFHPLAYFAWGFFLPYFFLGSLVVAAGFAQEDFMSLVQDVRVNLPLTMVYVMLGFGGLALGFVIPYAHTFGKWLGNQLPQSDFRPDRIVLGATILIIIGVVSLLIGFERGSIGYQKSDSIDVWATPVYLAALLMVEGSFLLWLYIFRVNRFCFRQIMIGGMIVAAGLFGWVLNGNRSGLWQIFLVAAFAFTFSGRSLGLRHYIPGVALIAILLMLGMLYGTTFRQLKGNTNRESIDEYSRTVFATLDRITQDDPTKSLTDASKTLMERIDNVTPLAVVVSNYEALAPYEESLGISNNIYNDTLTFMIPRFIWPNKPVGIEPTKYADLYFNFPDNVFTITPMGDLLRNFGPVGVPIGMFILGLVIQIIYSALIDNQIAGYWRVTLFYMLMTNINFEGTYGLIIPALFKTSVFAIVGLLVVRLCAGSSKMVS